MNKCIGLFGTVDGSKWRESFIEEYNQRKIKWFNPDAGDDWHPGMIENENKHLKEDCIILFPVLSESLGTGSLGEIGFSVLNSFRSVINGNNQYLIVLIDEECTDERKTEEQRKNSSNARKLVRSKMADVNHPNVFLVDTLDQMKDLSLRLWALIEQQESMIKAI